jgi:hypothetical protein
VTRKPTRKLPPLSLPPSPLPPLTVTRYCLTDGYYTLNLQDTELWETRKKHAKVIFSSGSANVTMEGTVEVMDFPVGVPWKSNKHGDNDDTPVTETVGFIVGITIACVVVAVLVGFVL